MLNYNLISYQFISNLILNCPEPNSIQQLQFWVGVTLKNQHRGILLYKNEDLNLCFQETHVLVASQTFQTIVSSSSSGSNVQGLSQLRLALKPRWKLTWA